MSQHRLVIKDAARQLIGRVLSWLLGFVVIKIMSPYLGPLRFGDYSTVMKYFAIRSALADFGLYVIAIRQLGLTKELEESGKVAKWSLAHEYGKFVGARFLSIIIVYTMAIVLAYFLPAYTSNPYLIRWLPLWMIFSATFMASGIAQIPLQLFWKMEKLSMALVLARIRQIGLLVAVIYRWYKGVDFTSGSSVSIVAFMLIIASVVLSATAQRRHVQWSANRLLPFRIIFDRSFIKNIYKNNRQYGIAYYLSSFHTLIVLILLSNFFPTAQGNIYTGIWALALALIEILLIIPSSLGNSLIHKIAWYSHTHMRMSFGNLLSLIYWIGGIIFINFWLFADPIIAIVGGETYLGTSLLNPGANQILPFLAWVLRLSFGKQVFNYLFVAIEKNNDIFRVNLVGVVIGLGVGLYTIPKYHLLWWIITQVVLEVLYFAGALCIAWYHKTMPFLSIKKIGYVTLVCGLITSITRYLTQHTIRHTRNFLWVALVLNSILIAVSYPTIKKFARGLVVE